MQATSYHVLSIQGEHPHVGMLVSRGGALWLNGMRIEGAPAALSRSAGGKIWAIGKFADGNGMKIKQFIHWELGAE